MAHFSWRVEWSPLCEMVTCGWHSGFQVWLGRSRDSDPISICPAPNQAQLFPFSQLLPSGPHFFFWRRKDHPEQKGLSILSYLKPSIEFCKKEYGKYSKSCFKSSEGRGKGSENNIMILFSGSQLRVPFFQTSGIPLKEEKNYFPSQYLRGETPLDLAVPYGLHFLSVPIQPAKGWNSARIASLLWKTLPNRRALMNQLGGGEGLQFPAGSQGQRTRHSGEEEGWTRGSRRWMGKGTEVTAREKWRGTEALCHLLIGGLVAWTGLASDSLWENLVRRVQGRRLNY